MSEGPTKRRWFQVSLRRLFSLVTIIAILTAWATFNWRRAQQRQEFIRLAGAIDDHARTIQGYQEKWDRKSIKWLLFGERRYTFMNLYPGTFDDAYLAKARELFPEAEIVSSSDPNVEPTNEPSD